MLSDIFRSSTLTHILGSGHTVWPLAQYHLRVLYAYRLIVEGVKTMMVLEMPVMVLEMLGRMTEMPEKMMEMVNET